MAINEYKAKPITTTEINERTQRKQMERPRQILKYEIFTLLSWLVGIWGYIYYYFAGNRICYTEKGLDLHFFFEHYFKPLWNINSLFILLAITISSYLFFSKYAERNSIHFRFHPNFEQRRSIKHTENTYRPFREILSYLAPCFWVIAVFGIEFAIRIYDLFLPCANYLRFLSGIICAYILAFRLLPKQTQCNDMGIIKQRYKVVLPVLMFFTFPMIVGFSTGNKIFSTINGRFDTWIISVYLICILYLATMKTLEKWSEKAGASIDHVFFLVSAGAMGTPLLFSATKIHAQTIWGSDICMDWLILMGLTTFIIMIKHWAEINKQMEYADILQERRGAAMHSYNLAVIEQLCHFGVSLLISYVILLFAFLNSRNYILTMIACGACVYSYLNMLYRVFLSDPSKKDFTDQPADYIIYKYIFPLIIAITIFIDKSVGYTKEKLFFTVTPNGMVTSLEVWLALILIASVLFFPYMLNYYLGKVRNPSEQTQKNAKKPKGASLFTAFQAFILVWGNVLGMNTEMADTENILSIFHSLDERSQNIWKRIIISEMMTGILLAALNVYLTVTRVPVELVLIIELFSVLFMIYDAYKLKLNLLLKLVRINEDYRDQEKK